MVISIVVVGYIWGGIGFEKQTVSQGQGVISTRDDEVSKVSTTAIDSGLIETRESKTSFADASSNSKVISSTPTGTVQEIEVDAEKSLQMIDLGKYDYNALVFKWDSGKFKYGFSSEKRVPTLRAVELSDEIGESVEFKISDLIVNEGKDYLFIEKVAELKDLRIHLIDPSEGDGYQTQNDSQGFNSGPKYSTLGIVPRENWSNNSRINDYRLKPAGLLTWKPCYYNVNKFVIHHTVTPNSGNGAEWVRTIYNVHAISNNWGDIGYNYLIDWNGKIYEGKLGGEEAKGYHAGPGNNNSIGIAMLGTYSDGLPTTAARASLRKLLAEKASFYDLNVKWHDTVYGHRDFMGTACPGQTLYDRLPRLTQNAQSYKNSHFGTIKSVVSKVNKNIDSSDYEEGRIVAQYNSSVSVSQIRNLIPLRTDDDPVKWVGFTNYAINGNRVDFTVDYDASNPPACGTQSTKNRLRTFYKVFWLRSNPQLTSLKFIYSPNEKESIEKEK